MIDLAAKPFYLKPEDIEWVNTTLAGMTTEEKAGQLFCVLFKECKPEEFEYVFNILKPGGCMYRVVPTERAIAATQNIYSRSKVPPLIAANLEKGGNGIVTEGTLVGAPMEIAATDDIGMATKMAHACAAEASAVGANWAFAPIIDIDTNYRNPSPTPVPLVATRSGCAAWAVLMWKKYRRWALPLPSSTSPVTARTSATSTWSLLSTAWIAIPG